MVKVFNSSAKLSLNLVRDFENKCSCFEDSVDNTRGNIYKYTFIYIIGSIYL